MGDDQPILRHNGVGIADMYSPEEYERLMAGDEVPNQTDVLTNQTDVLTNSQPQDKQPSVNMNSIKTGVLGVSFILIKKKKT